MTKSQRDWQGNPIPSEQLAAETPDTVVTLWEVTPPLNGEELDSVVFRDWRGMCEYLSHYAYLLLDDKEEPELREGVTIKIRLVDMALSDIREID